VLPGEVRVRREVCPDGGDHVQIGRRRAVADEGRVQLLRGSLRRGTSGSP
jgi:hypothetical protein